MRAVTSHGAGMTLFTFTPLQSAKLRYYWYFEAQRTLLEFSGLARRGGEPNVHPPAPRVTMGV